MENADTARTVLRSVVCVVFAGKERKGMNEASDLEGYLLPRVVSVMVNESRGQQDFKTELYANDSMIQECGSSLARR